MPRVSLIKDAERREIAKRSLELIAVDIKQGMAGKRPVIKPDCVSSG